MPGNARTLTGYAGFLSLFFSALEHNSFRPQGSKAQAVKCMREHILSLSGILPAPLALLSFVAFLLLKQKNNLRG